ncbi:MAG TPA: metal ABC transporter ATP-binding protein [Hyphomicrobiaceae bacterium]|jgi:zinc transport system ATP-binding protein|nr:metal ABC transporter ATP-binding protein [Hyphomicrobiaceae bacterium]
MDAVEAERVKTGPGSHGHGDHHAHGRAAGGEPAPGPLHPEVLISARGVGLTRSGRPILEAIDLDIRRREIVTLIGPNGAGKTTLVRVLLGLETPNTGEAKRAEALVVGYVPQRFDVDPAIPLSVARFVSLGRPSAREDIARTLSEVGAGALAERQLHELSGGELQRALLARALLRSPGLLVLDEPVRGVDYVGEAELYALIGRLRSERGLGVLLVSHDLHVVMAQSDRIVCINRHVCCSGVPESVAQHPEYARLFGPQAARAFGLYHHHHDHRHDLAGEPRPADHPSHPPAGE